jgi:hypothetical protein
MASKYLGVFYGQKDRGDKVLPLRVVRNDISGDVVVRCIAKTHGTECDKEWPVGNCWPSAIGHLEEEHSDGRLPGASG